MHWTSISTVGMSCQISSKFIPDIHNMLVPLWSWQIVSQRAALWHLWHWSFPIEGQPIITCILLFMEYWMLMTGGGPLVLLLQFVSQYTSSMVVSDDYVEFIHREWDIPHVHRYEIITRKLGNSLMWNSLIHRKSVHFNYHAICADNSSLLGHIRR